MKRKIKLSIYLVKEGIVGDSNILKPEILSSKICDKSNYSIYSSDIPEHPPLWSTFFNSIDGMNPTVSSTRVVVVKRVAIENIIKIFVMTFGQAGSFLKDDVFVEQFGIKILLNTLDSDQIRQISKRSVGGNQKSTREQLPRVSDIFEFGFDIQRDLIKAIAGKNDNDSTVLGKRMLYGSDLVSFSSDYDFENIDDLLRILYARYQDDRYKKKFEWIDYIREENNKSKKAKLDEELLLQIKNKNPNVWMAVPYAISWESINGFSIEGNRSNIYSDIEIDEVIKTFKDGLTSVEQLKSREIRAVSTDEDSVFVYKWSAYKCIVANISYGNEEYCISDGKWYKIDGDFVKDINERYNRIKICSESFIDYNHNNEDEYNEALANSLSGSIEFHKVGMITLQGKSKAEPCDVFYNKKIIHIKRTGGSSNLSHLFVQASNTSYLWGTSSGRNKLKTKISELDFNNFDKKDYEIVAGIIGKSDASGRPKIPFFSKITACNVYDELESKDFVFSLKTILNLKDGCERKKKINKNNDKVNNSF